MVLNGISLPGRLYHSNQTSYPWKYAAWSHLFLQYNGGLLISRVHCLKFSTYLIFTLLLPAIASLEWLRPNKKPAQHSAAVYGTSPALPLKL